jgi:sugar/nucleoside kinase (ribokinase family)
MTNAGTADSLACFGDLVWEVISRRKLAAGYQRTLTIDDREIALGGSPYNFAWYFARLHRPSMLISHHGCSDGKRIRKLLAKPALVSVALAEKTSMTDLLIVMPQVQMPAIYVAGRLDHSDILTMIGSLPASGLVVFGGSRYAALRQAFLTRISKSSEVKLVFAPSYSLYEYPDDEIAKFLDASDIAIVNQQEAEYVQERIGRGDLDAVMGRPKDGGIVTLGAGGADLYYHGAPRFHIPSVSGREEDVIGAGDAFVCGFLDSLIAGGTWREAARAACAIAAKVVSDGRVRAPIDA